MKVRKAVIPAAGLGTRMLPSTKSIPKELLPIYDKPALHYIVQEAVDSGIEDILIVTNRGKSSIEDYFDYSPELEASLEASGKRELLNIVRSTAELANFCFIRQKETKGLGHAVYTARSFVGDEPFAVLLGDDIMVSKKPVTLQLALAAEKYSASAVGVQSVSLDVIHKYCSLKVSEIEESIYDVFDAVEKPSPDQVHSNLAILGRYVLKSDIFTILENTKPGSGGEIQLTDGLNTLCKQSRMIAVEFEGKRYDTGNLQGFMEATIDFALKDESFSPWLKDLLATKIK